MVGPTWGSLIMALVPNNNNSWGHRETGLRRPGATLGRRGFLWAASWARPSLGPVLGRPWAILAVLRSSWRSSGRS
eukprot:5876723-Pyramimonas_sp.AAC.1